MASSSELSASSPPQGLLLRLHAALMPDYNRKASLYWWTVTSGGALALGAALWAIGGLPTTTLQQVLIGSVVAASAGMFPVRIPGSKNSFAAGEVFIILLLLLFGPAAAALAAAAEAFVGAMRSSKRWTSRLISPATAALSALLVGGLFELARTHMVVEPALRDTLVLALAMSFALTHFLCNTLLIALVPHLKQGTRLRSKDFIASFGWVGTTYAASALLASLMYLVCRTHGIGVMAGAIPLIGLLLVMLHYHFRQRESDERAQALRVDAAEREAAQVAAHMQALRESERRFHSAFAHAAIGMALVDADGRLRQVNPALCALLGLDESALVGQDVRAFVLDADLGALERIRQELLQQRDNLRSAHLRCRRADGTAIHVDLHSGRFADAQDGSARLILQLQDISARVSAEARLQHIAYHDSLTSLANRTHFRACLERAIARRGRDRNYGFAVMYLDFDRFKLLNDTLGHSAGDTFLFQAAQRICELVRPCDTVGRLGGDEFAILFDDLADEAVLTQLGQRLQAALAQPYVLNGSEVASSASIGITTSAFEYSLPDDVLRDADIAMYRAKAGGRGRIVLFDASLRAQVATQVSLEEALRKAVEREQLSLQFQPIWDLTQMRVESFEALLRWKHPDFGCVSPATFVPIAEEAALIGMLTDWVLENACAQLRRFQDAVTDDRRLRMHINVSGTDLCRANFVARVSHTLLRHRLEPGQLTLELTETMLMQRLDDALTAMNQLRDIGVELSVDDFGTGYSSLAYLSTLPISSLKIDRSFVRRLSEANRDAAIVQAVVSLGRTLGKVVIAEGIETPAQLDQLRAMNCQLGQGYLMAPPLDAAAAAELLSAPAQAAPARGAPRLAVVA